jgi:hypothetical protein
MNLKSSRLLIFVSSLGLFLIVGVLFFLYQFGSALRQEKDTPDVLKAAFHIELTRTDAATINSNPKRLLVRTFDALKVYMEQQGWTWTDQLGGMVIYQKGSQRLYSGCGMYSRSYMICDLSQIP